ncbi:MAG: hypothetical protein IIB60_00450 [Planctomycetes bacterium]|nr:hypothetical protein [Planctomycetota bacterium]
MRIVFLGSGVFAEPTLRWLAQSEHEIPLVITQPARGSGRGRKTSRTPVAAVAASLGLEVLETPDVNSGDLAAQIRDLGADFGLVIAFGQKLGAALLGSMPGGCVNLHASLLPKHRGAAPINWAILRGDRKTGCTVFRIINRMDAGSVLTSRWTFIKPEETAGELHDRLAAIGVDAVRSALDLFDEGGWPEGTAQCEDEATAAPKLAKSDGAIDFDRPSQDVANHICAMTPWPGARARLDAADGRWEIVQILRARPSENPTRPTVEPGTIDARLYVATGDGFVEFLEIKPCSGRTMGWQDYVNGRHIAPGDRFSTPSQG